MPKNIDSIILELVLSKDLETKEKLSQDIWDEAQSNGIVPCSIHDFYIARGQGKFNGFTVPAINLRALAYDLARAIFRVAKKNNCAAFIFEIAKSEMGYTDQRPVEYACAVLAAAIKENYKGPVFIQGDHFQVNAKKFKENSEKEIQGLKDLICEATAAGFFNIDIDSSTIVDLNQKDLTGQQRLNFEVCAKLTEFIRQQQPKGITISVGGEIGEVGTKNSTPEELEAFMKGYRQALEKGMTGISKISIQTGTSHGGVVLPDGSIAKVNLDFDTLKNLSKVARQNYGLAGAVQHGASTLPPEAFRKFAECEAAEVHLATEFQNMLYESKYFPADLKQKIYAWLKDNCKDEAKPGETEDQFFYKTRKKALGPFKKDIMTFPDKDKIAQEIEAKFEFLFKQLNVFGTRDLVDKFVKPIKVSRKAAKKSEMSGEGAD